ncbi:FeoB-associated Cys-rich membrane protein [Tellurirhabdus rosea]|uniref:FeoB-associated Cys-rich membrane protein n=1 Tax=Tellurirhabdus rosea TaxID=2674997 RepID=UPI00224F0D07|nr:FeoB-associated Cys-rich membrane protein [Tellurirhabdus rosea]
MIEQLIIGLLFLGALLYIGRRVYRTVFAKKTGCAKGCGCGEEKTALTGKTNKATTV